MRGIRGRRIGDTPYCARCGYDLTGRPESSNVCSECGATLTPQTTAIGQKRRRPALIAMGLLILLPSLAVTVFIVSGKAAEVDWQAHKPMWWLLAEAKGTGRTSELALVEILRRLQDSRLSEKNINDTIQEALRQQADRASAWNDLWGKLVELARAQGKVSDERWVQYAKNGLPELAVITRKRVRHGDPFVIGLRMPPGYYGDDAIWSVPELSVGVGPFPALLKTRGGTEYRVRLDETQWQQIASGWTSVRVSGKLAAMPARSDPQSPPLAERELAVDLPVEVLPPDVPSVRAVKDEAMRAAMEAAIAAGPIRRSPNGAVGCMISVRGAPIGVAYRASVITAEAEMEMLGGPAVAAGNNSAFGCMIEKPPSPVTGPTASIRLRPDAQSAVATLDVEAYWDGELLIEDIPVIDDPQGMWTTGDAYYFANGTVHDPIRRSTPTTRRVR